MQQNKSGWGKEFMETKGAEQDTSRAGSGMDLSPFLAIMGGQSLMSSNNGIAEMKEIKENLKESLKTQKSTASAEGIRLTIPSMLDMSTEQSQHLPGIILYVQMNQQMLLMPVLFYKKDIAQDALETINLGNNQPPQTYHKFAEAFVTDDLRNKVKDAFSTFNGQTISKTFIISSKVIDVDMFVNVAKDPKQSIDAIVIFFLLDFILIIPFYPKHCLLFL